MVRLLERREAREDHVGVAGRLVEPVVDADHAVELVERGVEPVAARRRQHRVAGDREERADLPVARASRSPRRGTTPARGRAPRARRAPASSSGRSSRPRLSSPGIGRSVSRPHRGPREHQPADARRSARSGCSRRRRASSRACRTPGCTGRSGRRRPRARSRRARGPTPRMRSASMPGDRPRPARVSIRRRAPRSLPRRRAGRPPCPSRTSPSVTTTFATASRSAASVPGVIAQPLVGRGRGAGAPGIDDDDLAAARPGSRRSRP